MSLDTLSLDRPFFEDLAIVLGVAALTTILFRSLRQPVILGYLLCGIIVGPHTPIPLFANPARIHALSELGVILVMFSLGLEFHVRRLVRILPTAGLVGLIQISTQLSLGYLLGRSLGFAPIPSLFAGAMVAISSTMIVARVLANRPPDAALSDLVFGILIVQDLAAVLLIALLTTLATGQALPSGLLAQSAGELLLFLAGIVIAGFLVVPRLFRLIARLENEETLLVASIGSCFGLALLAHHVGYSVALGAFVAGSLVAESGHGETIERLVRPVRDVFAAIFFVSIGILFDPNALLEGWPLALAAMGVVLLGMPLSITIGGFLSGHGLHNAVKAGLTLSQIGEFSFIIVGVGVTAGVLPDTFTAAAVGVAVITSFGTPFLVGASTSIANWIDRKLPRPLQTLVALYGTWVEALRRSPTTTGRRLVKLLLLDTAVLAAIALGTSLFLRKLVGLAGAGVGLSPAAAHAVVLGVALVISVPFWLGIVRLSRRLGALVVARTEQTGRADLGAAPRRTLIVVIQLAIVTLCMLPLLALSQPFLPLRWGLLAFAAAFLFLAALFWKRATNLHEHVRAGAEMVVEALRSQSTEPEPHLEEASSLLPGLGSLTPVALKNGSPAVGKTLAEINLRGLTGANVIAIQRRSGDVLTPTGKEPLEAGDVLTLTGTAEAIEAARRMLLSQRG